MARWRAALAREAVRPGDRVGILLRNCPEWVIFDQAALSLGLVTVPLYTDDRADSAAYIIQDSAIKVLLVQDGNRWGRISEALGESPCPVRVILMDPGRDAERLTREDAACGAGGGLGAPQGPGPGAARRQPRRPGHHRLHVRDHRAGPRGSCSATATCCSTPTPA